MKTLLEAVLLAACACTAVPAPRSASQALPTASAAPVVVVDGKEARRLVAAGVQVVDVRTPAEFAAGHVPGAVNIPYDEMPGRAQELGSPSAPVLVYCHSGRRSALAIRTLEEMGFSRIYDMKRYDAWVGSESASASAR